MALFGEIGFALIPTSNRAIGTIIPDVVLEEVHRDSLVITQHPVEKGVAITDHAFLRPAEVDMRCGFSNSSHGFEGYTRLVYEQLRQLQKSRQPFPVYTGKRAYKNMLIGDLGITTDRHTENVLLVFARLQEIIIVSTKTTGTGSNTTAPGQSKGDQASPSTTGGVENKGDQQGAGVGTQEFIGAAQPSFNPNNPGFNPGQFSPDGGTLGNGSFGLDGVGSGPGGGITLPEIAVTPDTPGGATEIPGVIADPYNPFGA